MSCLKAFGSSRLDGEAVGVHLCAIIEMCLCVCVCARVARTCGGSWLESTEPEKEREREKKKGERPPLAVPVGWFELGTPAGIQACTSCWGGGGEGKFVSVEGLRKDERKRGEGGGEGRGCLPAAAHPFVGTLPTMKTRCIKKKNKNPAACSVPQ